MNGTKLAKLAFVFWLTLWYATLAGQAQLIPPDPFYQLNDWQFKAPDYLSDAGDGPLGFTNINNPVSFDGNALQVDAPSNEVAFINYPIKDSISTNVMFFECTIEVWVLPDWNSGAGPGGWGRIVDIGQFSTNSPSSWFSLYFSPDGSSINFSSITNGLFTNYLSCPIAWSTNAWHLLDLTWNRDASKLYIDGQLATNGHGVFYEPSAAAETNGFFIGSASDGTPATQARAQFDDLATWSYALDPEEITNDYAAGLQAMNGSGPGFGDYTPVFPGGGTNGFGGGTNQPDAYTNTYYFGTNLALAAVEISNQIMGVLLTNTSSDILYELQGCSNLSLGNWFSEGFVYGPETTNYTSYTVPASKQGNLFLRIRSWVDDSGTGIPDWWWLQYEGQITNVNAYDEDPAGDGYTFLQKFDLGLNPDIFYTTNAPANFFGALDASGTNAYLEWTPMPGPVLHYAIQRGFLNTNGNYVYTQIGLISSNAVYFEDSGSISNANAQNNVYNLTAVYPGGSLSATDTWYVYWNYPDFGPPYGPPPPNNVYAYADANGTNVLISWTPALGQATNYIVLREVFDWDNGSNYIDQIGETVTNTTYFTDPGMAVIDEASNAFYVVEAVFPAGIMSQSGPAYVLTNPPPPNNFNAVVDATGTNVLLS